MSNINDLIVTTIGGVDVSQSLISFFQTNGATSSTLNEAQTEFFVARSVTSGSVDDRWRAFLEAQGYSGAVAEMQHQFWANGGTIV
jgi:hypothetical protein